MRRTPLFLAVVAAVLVTTTAFLPGTDPEPGSTPAASSSAIPVPSASPTSLRVLVLGDSISEVCITVSGWCGELVTSLAAVGVTVDIRAYASGGKRCAWVAAGVVAALAQHQPDVVLLNCGTNDDPNEICYGESCTAWAWRYTVEAAKAAGARVGVAFIGYTDPDEKRVLGNKPKLERTNDNLYTQIARFAGPWGLAVASFQKVPSDPVHLPDGVHPGGRGDTVYARIWHDALAEQGWVPAALGPPLCGMYGRRAGYPVPSTTPC